MQRIKWIDVRLQMWAEWRAGSCGYRSPDYEYDGDSGRVGSVVEINASQEADAMEIDAAVAQLPDDLKRTVIAHYTWDGGIDRMVDKLKVTRATIHRRLCHADIRISDWLDWKRQHEQRKLNVA